MDEVGVARPMKRPAMELAAVFFVVLAIYLVVTPQTNRAYRHYVYMASAFLHGRTDLRGVPEYYHDVIVFQGRTYAPFPPIPALLLMPLVAVEGEATDQGRVGQVIAALAVTVFVAGLRRLGVPWAVRLFCGTALAFGSVLWAATAIGTTWFFAQEVVVLATAGIVWELAGAARPAVLGLVVASAWLTRPSLLPAVLVLAAVVWLRHRDVRAVLSIVAINALGIVGFLAYDALRFGNPFQTGYGLLTMGTPNAEAAARWGFFNVHYIPEQLYTMLLRAPELIATPPFIRPSPWGMALVFTSPLILRLLFAPVDRRAWVQWGSFIAAMVAPMLVYFSVGWVQFGYRYSLDWWVFFLVLLAVALADRPKPVDYVLLSLSIAMNALGVYWVRVLGW